MTLFYDFVYIAPMMRETNFLLFSIGILWMVITKKLEANSLSLRLDDELAHSDPSPSLGVCEG